MVQMDDLEVIVLKIRVKERHRIQSLSTNNRSSKGAVLYKTYPR